MLSKRKMRDTVRVTGFQIPDQIFFLSSLSRTAPAVRSDWIRATANTFSSAESHRAVSGRSVRVRKATRARPTVMIPSIPKIIRQSVREPKRLRVRIPEAKRPPKAPARGAMTMYMLRRKANSLRRYHLDM